MILAAQQEITATKEDQKVTHHSDRKKESDVAAILIRAKGQTVLTTSDRKPINLYTLK